MKQEYISNNKEETWKIAKDILSKLKGENMIVLKGELGAGKTTFSQGILTLFGAEGPFTSPTFVIMKEYRLAQSKFGFEKIYHFDCYRIGVKDILDLGWKEISENPKNLILIEWPEKVEDALKGKYIKLDFEILRESKRRIKVCLRC